MRYTDCSLVVTKQNRESSFIVNTPKNMFQEQNFRATADEAIYSDSQVDNDTERCLAVHQNTGESDSFNLITMPDTVFLVFTSLAQSAVLYAKSPRTFSCRE